MRADELRQMFLDFFARKDHRVLPSASLIPEDPSTLFTSAGMQPFVPYFLGNERPPHSRLATCQKCLRSDDLDRVGHTARHCTFFEMLGNFSFGDYFKEEAIVWGWEFVREVLGIPEELLWVSVYEEDEESFRLWTEEVGVPADRVVCFGKEDNWWGPVGTSGPCGPCTEIFIDRGPALGEEDRPGKGRGDRFAELWNLVFQQYDQQPDGTLVPLPRPGIDTGAGLERVAAAMQEVPTIFDTDLVYPIVEQIVALARELGRSEVAYGVDPKDDVAIKIIADHARALAFAIADGALPSNKGRGSVLRRLLRRAAYYGRTLGIEQPFLYQLAPTIARLMARPYPEVQERLDTIMEVVQAEEARFQQTLERNLPRVDEVLAEARATGQLAVDGRVAYDLYSTYGIPLEMTEAFAVAQGLRVDQEGYALAEEAHQRVSSTGPGISHGDFADDLLNDLPPDTDFLGYDTTRAHGTVVAIAVGSELDPQRNILVGGERREALEPGEEGWVLLDRTPFYAESGGQVGDRGWWQRKEGKVEVCDTLKDKNERFLHRCRVVEGPALRVGEEVTAEVDVARREAIRRAHTATHLLHAALRRELGTHVLQAGSLVEANRLRFDFSHYAAVEPEQLARVERWVNEQVWANYPVQARLLPLPQAREQGAIALFGEKYEDIVRLVEIGEGVSRELCGGTHVQATGDIGPVHIVSESSIGAGVRRIEALVGPAALDYWRQREETLAQAATLLNVPPLELPTRMQTLLEQVRNLERKLEASQQQQAMSQLEMLLARVVKVNGASIVAEAVEGVDPQALRTLADRVCERLENGVALLGTVSGGKVVLLCKVAEPLTKRGLHAGNIVREAARVVGGGGGGRPTFAQAGGRDPSKLAAALAEGLALARRQLSENPGS
ncbi:MAG TPA: alanine--tRNA ligase [Armatimonadetes bacterium]|nr:alanine--tRNA ligase [Armatimonadota bacterium]